MSDAIESTTVNVVNDLSRSKTLCKSHQDNGENSYLLDGRQANSCNRDTISSATTSTANSTCTMSSTEQPSLQALCLFLCFADDIAISSPYPANPLVLKSAAQDRKPKKPSAIGRHNKRRQASTFDSDVSTAVTAALPVIISCGSRDNPLSNTDAQDDLSLGGDSVQSTSISSLISSPSSLSPSDSSVATLSTLLDSVASSSSSLVSGTSDALSRNLEDCTYNSNLPVRSLNLRKERKSRKRELRRLSMGNKAYRNYLMRQEEEVQYNARNHLRFLRRMSTKGKEESKRAFSTASTFKLGFSDNEDISGAGNELVTSVPESQTIKSHHRSSSFVQNLRRFMLFERYHTVPAVKALIMYSVAHSSCYEFIYQLHLGAFFSTQKWPLVHGLTFLVGVSLVRMSGSIWNWLSSDLYEGVKFDMHNKLRLQDLDARLLRCIRKRKHIRLILDIVGVYLCFISIGYALNELLLPAVCSIDNRVLEQLPSRTYGVDTGVNVIVDGETRQGHESSEHKFAGVLHTNLRNFIGQDQCMADDSAYYQDVMAMLHTADADFLSSRLSYSSYFALFGWQGAPMVTTQCQLTFNLLNSIISIAYLFRIGVGFWDE